MPLSDIKFNGPAQAVAGTQIAKRELMHPSQLEYIRATSLKTFSLCPYTWAHKYLATGPMTEEKRTGAAAVGTAVHLICEDFLMKLYGGRECNNDEEDEELKTAYATVPPAELDNVTKYLGSLGELPVTNPIAIEERLYHKMRHDAPPLSGQMDFVAEIGDNTLLILDHKTNRGYNGRDFWACQLQQLVYGWMARLEWPGFDKYKFRIGYPNLATHVEWETDPADDAQLSLRFDKMWAAMIGYAAAGEWPQTTNDECNWCDFKGRCDQYHGAVHRFAESFQQRVGVAPTAERLLYVKDVKKIVEQLEKELEESVAAEVVAAGGTLQSAGRTWTYEYGQRRVASPTEVMRELQAFTVANPDAVEMVAASVDDIFSVSVGALDALARRVPDLTGMVDRTAKKQPNGKLTLRGVETKKAIGK